MQLRLILLTGLLALCACASNPPAVEIPVATPDSADPTIPVYVASHGWHTGIILPAKSFNTRFPQLRARFGATPFYEFGWGDARYYPAKKITTAVTLRAALFSQSAVVQVVARIIAGGRSVSAADRHLANSIAQSLGLSPAIADQTIVSVLGR